MNTARFSFSFLFIFFSSICFSQQVIELKDINSGPDGSTPRYLLEGPNGQYYFSAFDGSIWGLWKTDGTPSNTIKVADLESDIPRNNIGLRKSIAFDGSLLYFWTEDSGDGNLNISDGNSVQQIFTLTDTENDRTIGNFAVTSGGVFFANDFDIYRTDGTSGGTQKIRYDPGGTKFLTAINDQLYYITQSPSGNFLYRGDSNGQNFQQIAQIGEAGDGNRLFAVDGKYAYVRYPSGGNSGFGDLTVEGFPTATDTWIGFQPERLTVIYNDEVYFYARRNDILGLHKIDTNGTNLIKAINDPDPDFTPTTTGLKVIGNRICFFLYLPPNAGIFSSQYWTSDGTNAGTNSLATYGAGSSFRPRFNEDENGRSFFIARPDAQQINQPLALFETDGTLAGTRQIVDIPQLPNSSTFENFIFDGADNVYFSVGFRTTSATELLVVDLDATGDCSITARVPFFSCQSQGTSTGGDDTYLIRLNVDGEFTGNSGWESTGGLNPAAEGFYNQGLGLLLELPAEFNETITIRDKEKTNCTTTIQLDFPGSCSDPDAPADLSLSDYQGPSNLAPGDNLGFTVDIQYISGPRVQATLEAYLSTDQTPDAGDLFVEIRNQLDFFRAGGRNDFAVNLPIPDNFSGGDYFLIVQLVPSPFTPFDDINPSNDQLIIPITVQDGGLSCSLSANISNVQCFPRSNGGDVWSFDFNVTGTGDLGNEFIMEIDGIQEGRFAYDITNTSRRFTIASGARTVTFRNSDGGAVCNFSTTVTPPSPCSVVEDGPTVTLSTPLSIVEEPFNVSVQFSESVTDFTLAEIQVTNGTKSNPAQQSGSSYSFTVTPVSEGEVTIFVPADAAFDSNGNGNQESDVLSVTFGNTGQPDLTSQFISLPSTVKINENLTYNFEVRNIGTVGSSATGGRIYVSTDAVFDSSDPAIGEFGIPALAGGANFTSNGTTSFDELGEVFLIVAADFDNLIAESNENNNVSIQAITVVEDNPGGDVDLSLTASADNNQSGYLYFF